MDKATKLEEILKVLDKDVPSTEEVALLISQIIEVVQQVKSSLEKQAEENKNKLNGSFDNAISKLDQIGERVLEESKSYTDAKRKENKNELDNLAGKIYQAVEEIRGLIPDMPDLSSLEKRIGEVEGKKMPELPTDLINEERLAEEVEILREEIKEATDKMDKRVSSIPRGGSRSYGASMKFYDLSSRTNGSLKVFSVPKSVSGVVLSSDFPSVLMEGNGFTLNGTRTTLTLTATNAPSSGSQLLFQYSSLFN